MRWPGWLGLTERRWKKSPDEEVQPAKTAWDLLQLLIVPAVLAAIALLFNASQASRDRSREDRRIQEDRALAEEARRDATLEAYFTKISDLILDRRLDQSKEGSAVRQVARTETLVTVRRLDGRRRGDVVRFLDEAGLLEPANPAHPERVGGGPRVNLEGANLQDVELVGFNAAGTSLSLSGTDLRGAKLDDSFLSKVDFSRADLTNASFKRATLASVNFEAANLTGASFRQTFVQDGTSFDYACVTRTRFVSTYFIGGKGDLTKFRAKGLATNLNDASGLDTVDFTGADLPGLRRNGKWEQPRNLKPSQAIKTNPCDA